MYGQWTVAMLPVFSLVNPLLVLELRMVWVGMSHLNEIFKKKK